MRKVDAHKIAVVGGTPFDAGQGVIFLKTMGISAEAIGLSAHPEEQTALYKYPAKVIERFKQKVQPETREHTIIFCNSLSFIADWSSHFQSSVWSLKDYYSEVFKNLSGEKTAILVAEGSMAKNLHKLIDENDASMHEFVSIYPDLDLIKQIEASTAGQKLELTKQAILGLKSKGYKAVVFGCTHFDDPSFSNFFEGVRVHQPGLEFLEKIAQTI